MNRNSLTTAVIAGIAGVAGIANMASAVNLNPDGLGQVLLYPYYTVNAHQQTLLSVVNTDTVNGKAVKVRFLEGYNSREVLDFNLFLSPADVWTAGIFSLSDAGVSGTGAGIFTFDNSCTAPKFPEGPLANGARYQHFLNYAYTGANADTGPTTDDRTREGHFEMIQMSDIVPGSDLAFDVTHVNSVPSDCSSAETDFEVNGTDTVAPTGGLFGAAAVVNVGQGTFYAYNADAIDGFSAIKLNTPTGFLTPTLAQVNDAAAGTATSFVFNNGALVTSPYPAPAQSIDAVSSLFEAANIYNQYETSTNGGVGTDWVVNFPTKRFYVDAKTFSLAKVIPPFEHLFGAKETGNDVGLSCTIVGITIFDREENTTTPTGCGFSPCPPGQPPSSVCHETNVITFDLTGTASILGSTLTANIQPIGNTGWTNLTLTGNGHDMRLANNGNQFHGLPITGFQATEFVNGSVGGVLSNYSGVFRHRQSRSCTNAGVGVSTPNGSGNLPACS
jgi:hypothetical protein